MVYPESWANNFNDVEDGRMLSSSTSLINIETDSDSSNLSFDWEFIELEPKRMTIQIIFQNPELVSMSSQSSSDSLVIEFPPELLGELVDKENGMPLDFSTFGDESTIRKKLPPQLPLGEATEQLQANA